MTSDAELHRLQSLIQQAIIRSPESIGYIVLAVLDQLINVCVAGDNPALRSIRKVQFYKPIVRELARQGLL